MQILLFLFSVCAGVDLFQQTKMRLDNGLSQCSAVDVKFSPVANAQYEVGKSGLYQCGNYIDRGSTSVLYEATMDGSSTKYAIKYIHGKAGKTHPIWHEYPFLYALNETGIAPRVFDVSSLVPIKESQRFFKNVSNATMGYIVMERVGEPLFSFFKGNKNITLTELWKYVFTIGIATTKLLKKLHSLGICHGDIHKNNIAFKDASRTDVVLLDFGNSVFMPDQKGEPWFDENLNAKMLSLWQLEGESPLAMRDDMYRLLETMVDFLTLGGLPSSLNFLAFKLAYKFVCPWIGFRTVSKMEVTKLIPIKRDMRIRGVDENRFPELFEMLNKELLPLVMNLSSPTDVPDYDTFIQVLENALEMVNKNSQNSQQ